MEARSLLLAPLAIDVADRALTGIAHLENVLCIIYFKYTANFNHGVSQAIRGILESSFTLPCSYTTLVHHIAQAMDIPPNALPKGALSRDKHYDSFRLTRGELAGLVSPDGSRAPWNKPDQAADNLYRIMLMKCGQPWEGKSVAQLFHARSAKIASIQTISQSQIHESSTTVTEQIISLKSTHTSKIERLGQNDVAMFEGGLESLGAAISNVQSRVSELGSKYEEEFAEVMKKRSALSAASAELEAETQELEARRQRLKGRRAELEREENELELKMTNKQIKQETYDLEQERKDLEQIRECNVAIQAHLREKRIHLRTQERRLAKRIVNLSQEQQALRKDQENFKESMEEVRESFMKGYTAFCIKMEEMGQDKR